MKRNDLSREKYLAGKSLHPEEEAIIQKDLDSPEFTGFRQDTGRSLLLPEAYSAESTYTIVKKRIGIEISKRTVWRYWPIAASIALLLGFAWFTLLRQSSLAQQLTASTGYGETMEIILPDSSVVVLNALSTLSYPEQFANKERLRSLNGEAYFKIRKGVGKPFKVQTGGIEVEVLGTVFNIQSYDNEEVIETSLLEGSVAVHYGENLQILKPGEMAQYNKVSSSLETVSENLTEIIQWQQGILAFENTPLAEILKTLERQYKVQFELNDENLQQLKITARFTSDETIEDIINILSSSAGFTTKKQKGKIIINNQIIIK
jgi:ferric-dicitrate binding protein FerR (iron transport regulator)